jgi:hypothetical protein
MIDGVRQSRRAIGDENGAATVSKREANRSLTVAAPFIQAEDRAYARSLNRHLVD